MQRDINSAFETRDWSSRPSREVEHPRLVVDGLVNAQGQVHGGNGQGAAEALRLAAPEVGLPHDDLEADAPATGLLHAGRMSLLAKRAVDVVGAALGLLLFAPVLVVTAVAVRLTSKGPIFYVHERIGRGGRPFRMIKFRSMYCDSHDRRVIYLDRNEATGPIFKIRRDPRVTPVGRIIRKTSIDELPQLINVLRGEMSLVGPRPPLPEEYATYGPRERRRLLVAPGITCIWQVSGRSTIADFDRWVDLDLEYIRNWTFSLDLVLLLRTIVAVLSTRGAW
jgi:lipopolysaccharide/colanic/teichoic acid biosynthesis glycosyltransferase